jgi:hypothetical protein
MPTPPRFGSASNDDPRELLLAALERESHYPPYRFVAVYGENYVPSPLPEDITPGKPKCCFANAFRLAREAPERFRYIEGYATLDTGPNMPARHAWCIDKDGRVVDPTWVQIAGEPLAYRGVALPLDLVQPYAFDFSRGTLDALGDRMEVVAVRLEVEPI